MKERTLRTLEFNKIKDKVEKYAITSSGKEMVHSLEPFKSTYEVEKKLEETNKKNKKAEAEEYIRMIVTDARVMKCYHKLVDDGILPEKFELKHMKHVAQNLPKAVYEDCVKEELEILKKAGEFGGKLCSKVTMEIIKDKLKIG